MIDRFGRTIDVEGDTYRIEGLEIVAETAEKALEVFNAMAPGDWPQPAAMDDLTAAQFAYLLAISGLETVWQEVESAAKQADPMLYATLRGTAARERFRFDETLTMIARFAPLVPAGTDLSRAALLPLWRQAAGF